MTDAVTIQRLRSLVLNAVEIKGITGWPAAMIEDYLNIIDNIVSLAELLDVEIDQKIEEVPTAFNDGSIPFAESGFLIEDADLSWDSINNILSATNALLSSLTASRLIASDGDKKLVSIADLTAWISGTANQITVTDDGDGTVTLSTPQDIDENADVTFDSATLNDLTALELVSSDAAKKLISIADGSADELLSTDGAGGYIFKTLTIPPQLIEISMYDAQPARTSVTEWNGGILSLATGQPLDSVPTDIVVTKGIGKLVIVVNAGSDLAGDITITGTSVDRNTGATTVADTETIAIDALTTDNTTTDANGNKVWGFVGAYISSKWFQGIVTLSTTDLTLTDVDVYHVSFEQLNDTPGIVLTTLDANIFTTNVNAEFDVYLHTLHVTGDKCNIDNNSSLHVGSAGMTAIANKYERLRIGNIGEILDGTTDGFWVNVYYSNSPAYVEDVTLRVWFTAEQDILLT